MMNSNQKLQIEQLWYQFSSFLIQTTPMIESIKKMVYSLINVALPQASHLPLSGIHSIKSACKRIYDDIKRSQSILKGYIKGKQSLHNSSATSSKIRKIERFTTKNRKKTNEDIIDTQVYQTQDQSIINYLQNDLKVQSECGNHFVKRDNYLNFKDITNHTGAKQTEATSQSRTKPQQMEIRIENIRASRNRDFQKISFGNDECLSIIKNIRKQLNIKKR